MLRYAAIILLPLLSVSCIDSQDSLARAARDRIMLVREQPPTLGHRRLVYQSAEHPDLSAFLNKNGEPEFIAETSSGDRRYIILYYLDRKKAYACRTWDNDNTIINFAGPYDVSDEEVSLLRGLMDNSPENAAGIAPGRLLVP